MQCFSYLTQLNQTKWNLSHLVWATRKPTLYADVPDSTLLNSTSWRVLLLDGKLFGKATGSSSFISQFENVLEIPRIHQLYLTDIKIPADLRKIHHKHPVFF